MGLGSRDGGGEAGRGGHSGEGCRRVCGGQSCGRANPGTSKSDLALENQVPPLPI